MATTYFTLSAKADIRNLKEIRVRFKHGSIDQQAKSNIFVLPEYWNNDEQKVIIPNFRLMNEEQRELKQTLTNLSEKLTTLTSEIHTSFNNADKQTIPADWLKTTIDKYNFPAKYEAKVEEAPKQSFFDAFDEFMTIKQFSEWRNKAFNVVIRTMKRYEMYVQITQDKPFSFEFDNVTPIIISDFVKFLRNEHSLFEKYPIIYETIKETRIPQPRGQNTISGILEKMRTFFIWAVDNEKTKNNPFRKYKIPECKYGTPFYISIEERKHLYNTDLSHNPSLEAQRDIFVFQCLIGCRVADLYRLTREKIINGKVEYIARKTKDREPITVEVPLNATAKAILDKYAQLEGDRLLPFISEQKYNVAIKKAFKIAGLTRPVTIFDPLTRESVVRPLNEIVSSHLARRCFVGNLYKQVKDPNLVGKLSGHKEGSRAFARYREIDDEMKTELVKMLE